MASGMNLWLEQGLGLEVHVGSIVWNPYPS